MRIVALEGVVENGQVQLPPDAALPERTKVYVIAPEVGEIKSPQTVHVWSPRLADPSQAPLFELEVTEERTNA